MCILVVFNYNKNISILLVLSLLVTIILNNNLVAVENRLSIREGFDNGYTQTLKYPSRKKSSRQKTTTTEFPERNNPDTENTFSDEENFASDDEDGDDPDDMLFDLHERSPTIDGSEDGAILMELEKILQSVQRCRDIIEERRE